MPIVEGMISDVLREAVNEMQYEDELAARDRHRKTLNFERAVAEMEKLRLEREDETTRKTIVSVFIIVIGILIYFPPLNVLFIKCNYTRILIFHHV